MANQLAAARARIKKLEEKIEAISNLKRYDIDCCGYDEEHEHGTWISSEALDAILSPTESVGSD